MDNLFTSLPLLRYLQEEHILVLGTLRINRANDASKMLVEPKLHSCGQCSIVTSDDNIKIVWWIDNKPVHTVSTFAGAEPEGLISRFDRKAKKRTTLSRPHSIGEYNKNMGGVDFMNDCPLFPWLQE
ncbi:hypothetical protein M8J76_014149 [Diaphorina citri]|nr:hypothetical protein M8J76_014149 [Diaphorina citri]